MGQATGRDIIPAVGLEGPRKVYSMINAVGLWAKAGNLDLQNG